MARLKNLTNRGLETQQILSEVLIQLIAEKPYDKISIKDITKRAEIDRTTFYLHFKDKDELFVKTQQHIINDLFSASVDSSKPYPRATVIFEHMAKHGDTYRSMLNIHGGTFFYTQLQDYLKEVTFPLLADIFTTENTFDELELGFLVNFMVGSFRGISQWWLEANMPYTPEEMSKTLC